MAPALSPAQTTGPEANEAPARRPLPTIAGLATATPERSLDQAQVLDLLGLGGDTAAREIFASCGVITRGLEITPESLATTLQDRTPATEEQLLRLATRAVDTLDLASHEVGVVVTANYYSLGGPTLAHRLVDHYELRSDTDKYHVVGVGCASAVPLLRLAAQALRDRPGEQALVVAAESVSGFLCPVAPGDEKVKIVGSALFGDGAAAALVSLEPNASGPRVVATEVHQLPDTLDAVRFAVGDQGSHMEIARELPAIAETEVPVLVHDFLARHELGIAAIDHWPVHPGGRGILDALRAGLGLSAERRRPERGRARRPWQRGHPLGLLRPRAHDRRAPPPARRPRSGGHDRAGRHRGADASAMASQSIEEMVS